MKKLLLFAIFSFITAGTALQAQGYYNPKDADQFFPDFKADKDMAVSMRKHNPTKFTVQYGGWITPAFITDYRNENYQLSTSITTADIWMKTYLWSDAYIYIRVKDTLTGILQNENYGDLDDIDNLFDLDVGYINMSFLDNMLRLQMGRKIFILGTGLVFNGRGDGIEFNFYSQWINFKIFGAYTGLIHKDNNLYQLSDDDYSDGAKRIFAGGEIWFPLENQELYLLGMAQIDMSDETAGARHKYNSQYFGGGLRGLILDAVSYYGEFVYETGTTFDADNKKHNIRAMAASFGLDYYIKAKTNPVLIVQYSYASGDKDRTTYDKGQIGSTTGPDTGFITFGTYTAGYALRPYPGNVHAVRAGFALSPFSWMDKFYLKRMTLISKYTFYMKDKTEGIISSGEATEDELIAGHGVDVSLRWKILSDFSFYVSYAAFLPGDAFGDAEDDTRHFIMEGITLSF